MLAPTLHDKSETSFTITTITMITTELGAVQQTVALEHMTAREPEDQQPVLRCPAQTCIHSCSALCAAPTSSQGRRSLLTHSVRHVYTLLRSPPRSASLFAIHLALVYAQSLLPPRCPL